MVLDKLTHRATQALLLLPLSKRVSTDKIKKAIIDANGVGKSLMQKIPILPKVKSIDTESLIKEAYFQSIKLEHLYVGTEHLLLALFKLSKSPNLEKVTTELMKLSVLPSEINSLEARKTPLLDSFSESSSNKKLDRDLISRDIYTKLVSSLLLKESFGVLLVGERGVGKKSLVEMLAKNIVSLNIPPSLVGYKIVEFDLLGFMSSIFNKGGLEVSLFTLLEELKSLGRVILYLKNFENIFFTSTSGLTVPMFYSIFRDALKENSIKAIATLDISIYDKIVLDNEYLLEGLAVVEIEEPSEKETLKILRSKANVLEKFHNIIISNDLIAYVYEKAGEGSLNTKLPQRGIDILDSACTYLVLKKGKIPESYRTLMNQSFDILSTMDTLLDRGKYDLAMTSRETLDNIEKKLARKENTIFFNNKKLLLTKPDIEKSLNTYTGLKMDKKSNNITLLSNLSGVMKGRIIGQDEAVDRVTKALIRSELGLRTKKRPLGNFLFLGPTGVGKTELARVLADSFYGKDSIIRLDMSDFAEKHTVARLVGAPPGYIGYGEGGELTTKIQAKPRSVVLFDEIEKAHPDVLNILLQIMEEAELRDAKGQTFDFSSAVVILTSNLGTEILHNGSIGFEEDRVSDKQVEGRLKNNLKKILKPELLNRFDEILIFKRLPKENQFKILDLLIKDVKKALKQQNIDVLIDTEVKNLLITKGYSEEYGARALRRTVETLLLDKIAEFLLENKKRPLSLKAITNEGNIEIVKRSK